MDMIMWNLGRGLMGIFALFFALVPLILAIYALLLVKSIRDNTEEMKTDLRLIKEILRQQGQ